MEDRLQKMGWPCFSCHYLFLSSKPGTQQNEVCRLLGSRALSTVIWERGNPSQEIYLLA